MSSTPPAAAEGLGQREGPETQLRAPLHQDVADALLGVGPPIQFGDDRLGLIVHEITGPLPESQLLFREAEINHVGVPSMMPREP